MPEDNKNILELLKEIGFNEYKAKVFEVLATGKILSASEIVNEAKIVRGSIYDILKSFVKMGYCNEIETNSILQYQIIDPDVILDKIIKERTGEYNKSVNKLKSTFSAVKEKYLSSSNSENKSINIELIRGYNKHRISKLKQLMISAKKEICSMYTFKGLVSGEADEITKNFIKRGGRIRTIYKYGLDFKILNEKDISDATGEELLTICKKFEAMGEEVRITKNDIPNMTIVDSENVYINMDDNHIPQQSRADIIMRRAGFAKYMMDLFEFYWKESFTLKEYKKAIKEKI